MNLRAHLCVIDRHIILFLRRISPTLARAALALVFIWFGILKVIGTSPANPLVAALLEQTLPMVDPATFFVFLGLLETLIGILFLIPHAERAAMALLVPHMMSTFLPLVMLPSATWLSAFTPTLEGQYIIKNLIIIALAFGIASNLEPMKKRRWFHFE